MQPITGTFTVAAKSNTFLLLAGQALHATLVVAHLKTFSGKVRLEQSRTGGQTWEPVVGVDEVDGTGAAIEEGTPLDAIVRNETGDRALYRLNNRTDSADDEATYTLELSPAIPNAEAVAVTHATMLVWLATLPTSDPAVVGEPWLDAGVLTVSAG